jgi:hypothetical protein
MINVRIMNYELRKMQDAKSAKEERKGSDFHRTRRGINYEL